MTALIDVRTVALGLAGGRRVRFQSRIVAGRSLPRPRKHGNVIYVPVGTPFADGAVLRQQIAAYLIVESVSPAEPGAKA